MLDLLGIIFPVFALIALGYLSVRRRAFTLPDIKVLGQYMLNFALPALLFNAVAKNDLSDVLNPTYMAAYLVAALGTAAIGYLAFALQGMGAARRGLAALGMSCSNSANFGYPVLFLALPEVAQSSFAMNVAVETLVIVPLGLFLIALGRPPSGHGRLWDFLVVMGSVLRRPMMIGFLCGLVVAFAGIPVPAPAGQLLTMLAASAVPVALFVVGGSLAGVNTGGDRLHAAQISLGKLVVEPLLAAGAVALLALAGHDLPPDLYAALILTAGMPMLSILTAFAQPYGHEGLASLAVLMATLGSFVTLTFLLWLLT